MVKGSRPTSKGNISLEGASNKLSGDKELSAGLLSHADVNLSSPYAPNPKDCLASAEPIPPFGPPPSEANLDDISCSSESDSDYDSIDEEGYETDCESSRATKGDIDDEVYAQLSTIDIYDSWGSGDDSPLTDNLSDEECLKSGVLTSDEKKHLRKLQEGSQSDRDFLRAPAILLSNKKHLPDKEVVEAKIMSFKERSKNINISVSACRYLHKLAELSNVKCSKLPKNFPVASHSLSEITKDMPATTQGGMWLRTNPETIKADKNLKKDFKNFLLASMKKTRMDVQYKLKIGEPLNDLINVYNVRASFNKRLLSAHVESASKLAT